MARVWRHGVDSRDENALHEHWSLWGA
eukprot:COSAG01_NODE_64092_length_277_cov_4.792135_1_plen_26_part_10